jgi:HK97 family phage major capsid protein
MNINEHDNTITATRDEFTTIIDKALDRKIKALPDRSAIASLQGESLRDASSTMLRSNPSGIATSPSAPRNDAFDTKHDREKILKTFRFFHAVANNDHSELRAIMQTYDPEYVRVLAPQIEGTNSAGGYLVPQEFYADVLFLLNEYGFARKYCAQIQMNSNVLNVSTLTGKPSVAWVLENAAIPSSKGTFARLTLTANKLAAIYPISNELLQDANVDVYNTILRIFVEVFGAEEDTQVFRGTGSPFTGILNTAGVATTYLGGSSTSTKTKYTDITLDDLVNLVQSIGPAQ